MFRRARALCNVGPMRHDPWSDVEVDGVGQSRQKKQSCGCVMDRCRSKPDSTWLQRSDWISSYAGVQVLAKPMQAHANHVKLQAVSPVPACCRGPGLARRHEASRLSHGSGNSPLHSRSYIMHHASCITHHSYTVLLLKLLARCSGRGVATASASLQGRDG